MQSILWWIVFNLIIIRAVGFNVAPKLFALKFYKKGLDNTEGKIVAEGTLSVQTPLIQNNQGVIWSNQGVKLNTNAGHIESQSGYLFGKNSLDISTSTLNNQKGEMLGGQVFIGCTASLIMRKES